MAIDADPAATASEGARAHRIHANKYSLLLAFSITVHAAGKLAAALEEDDVRLPLKKLTLQFDDDSFRQPDSPERKLEKKRAALAEWLEKAVIPDDWAAYLVNALRPHITFIEWLPETRAFYPEHDLKFAPPPKKADDTTAAAN